MSRSLLYSLKGFIAPGRFGVAPAIRRVLSHGGLKKYESANIKLFNRFAK